jgi:hypothetical protein
VAFDRGYNPLVDLQTVCETIPTAINNAYYLDATIDNVVVMDVEPKCPEPLKQKFLQLPYLYGETSMSGKGLHLIFDCPKQLLEKYPNAAKKMSLQSSNGYYEILLNHMVTFTRNVIPVSECGADISAFENIFELLAADAKPPSGTGESITIDDIDTDSIPYHDELMEALKYQKYGKTIKDFPKNGATSGYDNSSYEFGMSGFYYRALKKLLPNNRYKDHDYTDEEKAIMVYECTSMHLEHRPKHDTARRGMPWLLFIAATLISKSD